ncbi:hypothetical protein V757_12545 [Pelistega indica]|uniref:Uncharacterized protein n=1 Tax=Pelistega indica TaxID=1414851 RepID=V8FRP9_9BURK|nr:hypothetical protein [Pelistega indica]ETD66546.1 hypothetical protein V757_12545 [Pelistega indica]
MNSDYYLLNKVADIKNKNEEEFIKELYQLKTIVKDKQYFINTLEIWKKHGTAIPDDLFN